MTPEQQLLFDALTPLQQRMCTISIENPNLSQRQVYLLAGGSAKTETAQDTSACEIMNNLQVKAFTDSVKVQSVSDAIMTREEAMAKLSLIARTDLKDIVKFSTATIGKDMETGDDLNQTAWQINSDLQANNDDKLSIISELEVGKFGPKIKTHNQLAAIAQLAKMQGWEAAQKFEHTGANGGPIRHAQELSDEQLEALARTAGAE